jgi:hypothetical protein
LPGVRQAVCIDPQKTLGDLGGRGHRVARAGRLLLILSEGFFSPCGKRWGLMRGN